MSRPISASYLERKLRAATGVQGENPLPDLSDVRGLITLENDRPEWFKAAGEELYTGLGSVVAAAQFAVARLRNPVGSGIIVVVELIEIASTVGFTDRIRIGYLNTDLATGLNVKSIRDTRGRSAGTQTGSGALMSRDVGAADPGAGQIIREMTIGVNTGDRYEKVIILGEGTFVEVASTAAITGTLMANFSWRERALEGLLEIK